MTAVKATNRRMDTTRTGPATLGNESQRALVLVHVRFRRPPPEPYPRRYLSVSVFTERISSSFASVTSGSLISPLRIR